MNLRCFGFSSESYNFPQRVCNVSNSREFIVLSENVNGITIAENATR